MLFYSTNNKAIRVPFREAVLKGLADDNGLFMPLGIPAWKPDYVEGLCRQEPEEIMFQVARVFLREDIPDTRLRQIVKDSVNFPIPLVPVHDALYALELFHGPTLAFKDVGARFMARVLAYLLEDADREVTVLVATSGDTGSAVANGFLGVKGIRVVILYPSGKVSEIQEKQLTTLGQNITAIEVEGTFDDCQSLVKKAFLDKELAASVTLTSANSINIARLLPQMFYYFLAWAQLPEKKTPVVVAVPSGNFGNLTAGLMAKKMGLPVNRFIAATNVNDIVPRYLVTGVFTPQPSLATISNAMDVGNPSNFARMLDLYHHNREAMHADIAGYSISDDDTRDMMRTVYRNWNYLLDTHGAVGYAALARYLQRHPAQGIFLETAHPAKFADIVQATVGITVAIPERLRSCLKKEKQSLRMRNSYEDLRAILKS
ncbi:MAG: threonine synthase [Chitinophagales bacterium]|nr:MAG: threonine synthase [Chitinophagales bacterium]